MIALVVAIVVVVNLIAGQLPENVKALMSVIRKSIRFQKRVKDPEQT